MVALMASLRLASIQPRDTHPLLRGREGDEAVLPFPAVGVDEERLSPGLPRVLRNASLHVVVVSGSTAPGQPVDHHRAIGEDTDSGKIRPVPPEVLALLNCSRLLPGAAFLAV